MKWKREVKREKVVEMKMEKKRNSGKGGTWIEEKREKEIASERERDRGGGEREEERR